MSSKSLGEPIGGAANLFAWGENQLIKLYDDEAPAGWVEQMARVDHALYAAGLPVPATSGEIVEVNGARGLVYERIEGVPIAHALLGAPDVNADTVAQLAHTFAEAHARVHACGNIPEVPLQRQFFPTVIRRLDVLPPDLKEAVLKALDSLPDGDRLCHGDFHPFNVLLSPRGPIVIDWNNAHIGNPLKDVARSSLILEGVSISQPEVQPLVDQFRQAYLERYFELRPDDDREQLAACRPVVAAMRLSDGILEIKDWLLEQIKTGLAAL